MKYRFLITSVFTWVVFCTYGQEPDFQVHEGMTATLFAMEPNVQDPSAMDVDAKGRVWVAEIVNYRGKNGLRPEGDRIVVLEDSDGDGVSDKTTVFYQENDFRSPHGVCVIGEGKVIVSVGDRVLILTDTDGDLKADKKEVLFSKIGGSQHDHGIHAFVPGPDGRLYFNFGNSGKQIADSNGKVVVDKSGREVKESRNPLAQPYRQGMVFRCEPDGSKVETLAWNFRNNWDLAVDSYGTIWQSDNDDDGNKGCHASYVMEYGDFGYTSGVNAANWNSYRHNMHPERGYAHFHQNDPGVIPYLYYYGAGSPTGIIVYEGDLLPSALRDQIIHCEARDLSVRAYPRQDDGAGYAATMVNVLRTQRYNQFRPSDVVTAPDGSLFVADWHDTGVGGHGARILQTGRIYRVAPVSAQASYMAPRHDLATVGGAIAALLNPNKSAQYQAHHALVKMGAAAEQALQRLYTSGIPAHRARALWILVKLAPKTYLEQGITDADHNIRIVAIRAARQHDLASAAFLKRASVDAHPQVRREVCLGLREVNGPEVPGIWADLAVHYDGQDRWYVEALGIAADYRWEACLDAWLTRKPDSKSASYLNILWRSRSPKHAPLLAELILDQARTEADIRRLFRAIDFLPDHFDRGSFYQGLVTDSHANKNIIEGLVLRSISRIPLDKYPGLSTLILTSINKLIGTRTFIDMTVDGRLQVFYQGLFEMCHKEQYQDMATYAADGYVKAAAHRSIQKDVDGLTEMELLRFIYALGNSKERASSEALLLLLKKHGLGTPRCAAVP